MNLSPDFDALSNCHIWRGGGEWEFVDRQTASQALRTAAATNDSRTARSGRPGCAVTPPGHDPSTNSTAALTLAAPHCPNVVSVNNDSPLQKNYDMNVFRVDPPDTDHDDGGMLHSFIQQMYSLGDKQVHVISCAHCICTRTL